MRDTFSFRTGSVVGYDHLKIDKNNQDSHHIISSEDISVAIVSDGCGSCQYSEVGAIFGSQLLAKIVVAQARKALNHYADEPELLTLQILNTDFWEEIRQKALSQLKMIAGILGEDEKTVLEQNFLFTVLGVLITPIRSVFFGIGDGVIAINGEIKVLEPCEGNKPIYLAYGLTGAGGEVSDEECKFQIHHSLWTSELDSFLLATDGVKELMEDELEQIPEGEEAVNSLRQFWEDEKYIQHEQALFKSLQILNGGRFRFGDTFYKSRPSFSDDATVVLGFRQEPSDTLEIKGEKNGLVPQQPKGNAGRKHVSKSGRRS